jgi:hypothetical protein
VIPTAAPLFPASTIFTGRKLIAAGEGVTVKSVAAHTTYPFIMINYFIREAFGVTYFRVFG